MAIYNKKKEIKKHKECLSELKKVIDLRQSVPNKGLKLMLSAYFFDRVLR